MKLQARDYRERTDLDAMRQLVMAGAQAGIAASYMHPGFLDWATQNPPDEAASRRNLRLWERVERDGARLEAFAIYFQHEGSFDLFVSPALHGSTLHERVMDEFTAWAEARGRDAGLKHIWPFWAMTYDVSLEAMMTARGWVIERPEPAPPLFGRDLEALPDVALPPGFTVQGVSSAEDGQARARVNYDALRIKARWDEIGSEYARSMGAAVYDGERDLFVRAPDGRGAAGCTIWLDPVNKVGLFEPVATHPDFRRLGLGKAVMTEGMRRMKQAGMEQAIVGFDPNNAPARALYTAMGFRAVAYFTVARKTFAY